MIDSSESAGDPGKDGRGGIIQALRRSPLVGADLEMERERLTQRTAPSHDAEED